ncbi:unnamed protein product [Clonostachys chloroleuca]|uniref:Uncharacterized protein n=1 Tax=Clonostachys chloroleuca TaxID=1926264 RepID=A0AA35LZA7_9HYPO|nr:unnamed protein product [Clonostachys chloroleuca]
MPPKRKAHGAAADSVKADADDDLDGGTADIQKRGNELEEEADGLVGFWVLLGSQPVRKLRGPYTVIAEPTS